ncbi:hypothetical protein ACFYE9_11505 [Rhizobium leguminosarum]|nr:hypothetical protein [Rhizobium leguminosarum]
MRYAMRILAVSGVLSVTSLMTGADAQNPVADFFLDGISDKAEDLMAKARSEANAVTWGVADAAKSTIEAWKQANIELLDKAFTDLSKQHQELFNNMNETMDRLEAGENLVVKDAEKLTVEWASVIKDLPFVDHSPEVMNYRPRVIIPVGEGEVPMVVDGPSLGSASPSLNSGDKRIPVARSTDNQLLAKLNRADLKFDEVKSSFVEYKLSFDNSVSSWWRPWTWGKKERIEREATVWLLPKQMASFTITPMMPSEDVAVGTYSTQVGGRGKDTPYPVNVPLAPLWVDQGYVYDTATIAQNKFFSNAGGDHADCVGAKIDSIKSSSFTFMMQMGHRSVWGGRRDAWVNCNLAIPIVKRTPSRVKGDEITGVLNWTDDSLLSLPEGTLDYTVTLKMFNGRTYVLTRETADPTGVISVQKTEKGLLFRPKPPSDF